MYSHTSSTQNGITELSNGRRPPLADWWPHCCPASRLLSRPLSYTMAQLREQSSPIFGSSGPLSWGNWQGLASSWWELDRVCMFKLGIQHWDMAKAPNISVSFSVSRILQILSTRGHLSWKHTSAEQLGEAWRSGIWRLLRLTQV